ncbi:hypothetical protein CC86DRAFT_410810 [Ophiobolus disseminans]|uniref:Uncharacterized protein n=1 Tax=Ophiobolus disseminans TaxID=1469910 RepID=A0A6A6ZNA9_9PLEO|nr:hypothetical protein CC86DRAFT_410810 [Ophiobolus disseminans]
MSPPNPPPTLLPDLDVLALTKRLQSSLPVHPYLKHAYAIAHDGFVTPFDTSKCSQISLDFLALNLSAWAEMTAQEAGYGTLAPTEWVMKREKTLLGSAPKKKSKKKQKEEEEERFEYQMVMKIVRGEGMCWVVATEKATEDEQEAVSSWVDKVLELSYEFVGELKKHPVPVGGIDAFWADWLERLRGGEGRNDGLMGCTNRID